MKPINGSEASAENVPASTTPAEVITGPVLSRLYNAPIEVHRVGGRIFVMSGSVEVERDAHRHDDQGHAGHHHA